MIAKHLALKSQVRDVLRESLVKHRGIYNVEIGISVFCETCPFKQQLCWWGLHLLVLNKEKLQNHDSQASCLLASWQSYAEFFLKGPLSSLEKSCPKSLTSIVHNRSCWNKCSPLGNCALGRTPKGNPDDFHIALIEQSVFRNQSYKWHRSSISIYQKANRKQQKVDSWVSEIEIIFCLSPPKHMTPEELLHVTGSWKEGKYSYSIQRRNIKAIQLKYSI